MTEKEKTDWFIASVILLLLAIIGCLIYRLVEQQKHQEITKSNFEYEKAVLTKIIEDAEGRNTQIQDSLNKALLINKKEKHGIIQHYDTVYNSIGALRNDSASTLLHLKLQQLRGFAY